MAIEKYYRSPIDKLVVESGMTATLIAQYMQIKYHRMVALRRLKDVKEKDIELCKQAIAKIIDDKIPFRRGNIPVVKSKVTESDIKLLELVKPTPEALAFMLGQVLGLLDAIFDTLDTNHVEIPQLLARKKQLEEQCNKLLDI
jgi:hypothetical protein